MDTRFWGPGAWRLLHTIAYHSTATEEQLKDFFDVLPYVLPCKFCRASLTEYYADIPTSTILNGRQAAQEWLYRIHNKVNGKLRKQGLYASTNPTLSSVSTMYSRLHPEFPAWDFLYSIAYNHPLKVKSTPMPGAPPAASLPSSPMDDVTLNKWNLLPDRERFTYWCKFWKLLPVVLPPLWQNEWNKADDRTIHPCTLKGRRDSVLWLWALRCKFDAQTHDPYREVCSRLIQHSSGCSKSRRAKTCRAKRKPKT